MSHLQQLFLVVLLFSCGYSYKISQLDRNIPSYTAAVVELNPHSLTTTSDCNRAVLTQIVDIIQSEEVSEADIIVFPESILNNKSVPLQLPKSLNRIGSNAPFVLRNISSAARNAQKYVVINLYVEIKCADDDQPFCTYDDRYNLYNMAIVFDRDGDVIAKYRKYNLFNEAKFQKTVTPDLVTFRTDFNVTFGVVVCFDLMFAEPALTLVGQGVKHFVYPTMWSSGIPYLTAVQFQQSWAYANNAVLLAANANIPAIKSSGSGIHAGRMGALKAFISETATTKILIAKVPIDTDVLDSTHPNHHDFANTEIEENDASNGDVWKYVSQPLTDFLQEDLTKYTIQFVDFAKNLSQAGSVCNNGICCSYDIEVSDNGAEEDKASYAYAIAVFNGRRSYRPNNGVHTAQAVCSLIACATMHLSNSCGRRILAKETQNRYTFDKLALKTELTSNHTQAMPNSLTDDLLPLTPTEFQYHISKSGENGTLAVDLQLKMPKSNLLTFAIYSRDFSNDITRKVESFSSIIR